MKPQTTGLATVVLSTALCALAQAQTYPSRPVTLIVPLAAFDNKGHRIGYGAGYYDMTINRLRVLKQVTAIGFAYAAQQVAVVPIETHDARLDYVLTEREVIKCRK